MRSRRKLDRLARRSHRAKVDRVRPTVLVCAAIAAACAGPTAATDAGAADTGVEPARDAGREGLPVPEPSALPIGPNDALVVGPGLALDAQSALSIDDEGAVTLVFDTFDRDFRQGELWIARSIDGRRFPLARPSGHTPHPLEASPSFVRGALYFAGADDPTGAAVLYRARVGGADALPAVPGLSSLLSWPQLAPWGDRVAIAFRDDAGRPMFAAGDDAESFGAPVVVGPDAAAVPIVAAFGDGSLAYAYQHPVGAEPMVSFVRRSSDGVTWTDPVRVTDASSNVHDAAFVARSDGGLDLYYAYPGVAGFALFRRALSADGVLGPEERVTADEVGEASKPRGLRLPSGRVLVTFAEIEARDSGTGEPTRQRLRIASLPGEAPPP